MRRFKTEDVINVRKMYIKGIPASDIAVKFNTSSANISNILGGRQYADVEGFDYAYKYHNSFHYKNKLYTLSYRYVNKLSTHLNLSSKTITTYVALTLIKRACNIMDYNTFVELYKKNNYAEVIEYNPNKLVNKPVTKINTRVIKQNIDVSIEYKVIQDFIHPLYGNIKAGTNLKEHDNEHYFFDVDSKNTVLIKKEIAEAIPDAFEKVKHTTTIVFNGKEINITEVNGEITFKINTNGNK
jgi:hypothetical protein